MDLVDVEQFLDQKFGADNWDVKPYLSPSEKAINKPILPTTDPTTNRMGHPRNWVGPDTGLLQVVFYSFNGTRHTGVFKTIEDAIAWLSRQNPATGEVVP